MAACRRKQPLQDALSSSASPRSSDDTSDASPSSPAAGEIVRCGTEGGYWQPGDRIAVENDEALELKIDRFVCIIYATLVANNFC